MKYKYTKTNKNIMILAFSEKLSYESIEINFSIINTSVTGGLTAVLRPGSLQVH